MSTVENTPHKEIHSEQDRRIKAQEKMQKAKEGHLPDNTELSDGIEKVRYGLNCENPNLSKTGKLVTEDINLLLDDAQLVLNEKNDGNLLQNAYYHSQKAGSNKSYSQRIAQLKEIARGDSSATREEAKKNVSSMGTIVKLALISPEFRETINDIADVLNLLLKRQSDKSEGKHSDSHPQGDLTTKTTQKTEAQRTVRPDGQVEACVVETNPTTEIVSKKEEKKQKNKEREDKLVDRLVDLAQTLHKHPEYRNSIDYMTNSVAKLKKYSSDEGKKMKEKRREDKSKENTIEKEAHKKEIKMNTKKFAENWIGDGYSLDLLIRQINFLYEKSKSDPELRTLLQDWKKWLTSSVKDSSYVSDKQTMRSDIKKLIADTKKMNKRYKDEVFIIRKEVNYINKSIQRDDSIMKIRSDVSKLSRDILRDENGKPVLKPELLQDAQIIIGSIIDSIKYIPLPPIKRSDENMDIELENIVLNATDVTPSNIRFMVKADTDRSGPSGSRQPNNSFLIEIAKIRAHLTSVNFYMNKKTGFPKIEDRGLADIDLMGNGLSLVVEVAPKIVKTGKEVHSVFETKNVSCTVDKLKIHLRETSHDTLYKILSPIINMVAKKKIESGISNYIRENMDKVNHMGSKQATQSANKADAKIKEKKAKHTEQQPATVTEPQPATVVQPQE